MPVLTPGDVEASAVEHDPRLFYSKPAPVRRNECGTGAGLL